MFPSAAAIAYVRHLAAFALFAAVVYEHLAIGEELTHG